jgi:hypothetical protein
MGVRWDAVGGRFNAHPPVKLVEGRQSASGGGLRQFDVTADGSRFLMIREGSDKSPAPDDSIIVVQNFVEDLKRLLPPK